MFWRYNLITGSSIETLLDKENVTLKELLEEDDILQECKAQTKKLIDFLIRPEILDEMVSMITEEPKNEGDEKLRYRYSNRACELLTFDIAQINDALSDEALLEKLYNFLDTDEPLNPLLASFFSKTMGLLITKKTEVVFNFLKDKNFIHLVLNHFETSAIMDLLLRFVSAVPKWLNEQKVIEQLVSRIDVSYNEEVNCNAANALCDIIKMARENMSLLQEKAEPNPLLQTIESVEVISNLLNHMLKDVTKESPIVNGISVLLALLTFKKQGPAGVQQIPSNQNDQSLQADNVPSCFLALFRSSETEQMTALDAERLAHGVNNVLTAIIPHLEKFHNLLLNPPIKPAITLTFGRLEPPLGYCRLEVAHLLSALISTNNHDVNVKLVSLETIIVLMDMFFEYSWNNFLHTQVEQAIGRIIANNPTVDTEGNKVHPLLDQILLQYKITVKILEAFDDREVESDAGINRKGYMGHLTKMANQVAQNIENGVNSNFIKEKIKDLPDDHFKKWEEFVNGNLAEINKKNATQAITGAGLPSSSTDEDSVDFRDSPFGKDASVHLAFSDYQMHEMTSNFVDQFGFNDDEFSDANESLIYARNTMNPLSQNFQLADGSNMRSAELFEEVCRVKNNPDGDSALWNEREKSTAFNTCFSLNKSEENSSDSDEEIQVFENASIAIPSEEMKMDVDSNEGMFDNGVPMDVAPANIPNPWETSEVSSSSSDDQGNWADFSNFAAFGSSTSDQSDVIGTVTSMETSDTSSVKCASNSDATAPAANAAVHCLSSTLTKEVNQTETISEKPKDLTALFDEESCSATSVQNGPV